MHFGVTRQHADQLALQGVIERLPTGLFDQDRSRPNYFNHLRVAAPQKPKGPMRNWLRHGPNGFS
jgi:hypothetical protein